MIPFGRRRASSVAALVACETCGFASPPGTPTCPYCGLDPAYRAPADEPVTYDLMGRPVLSTRMTMEAISGGLGFIGAVVLVVAAITPEAGFVLWLVALVLLAIGAIGLREMQRRYRPRRAMTGTLKEAEETLDTALADARERWTRLDTLHRHAPTGSETDATRTLGTARRVLAARLDALERARFDLRLVWWKNRVDLALARSSAGETSASDTLADLTGLRDEATRVLATLGATRSDVYADVRPRLDAARAALDTLVGRLFEDSVAEAVAGITAPLDGVSVVRADVEAALDGLAAITAAAPAAARAADLTRESARLSLELDDLGDAPDTSAPNGVRLRG